jgi:probable HAF family extracellular repeat protein
MIDRTQSQPKRTTGIAVKRALVFLAFSTLPCLAIAASFTPLGDLPGGDQSSAATGVSGDGRVVVGFSSSAASTASTGNATEAFFWTLDFGMTGLGDLPGDIFGSHAVGVSASGDVVAGSGRSSSVFDTFLWTPSTGMTSINSPVSGPFASHPNVISANGNAIVGHTTAGNQAFRWTSTTGTVLLTESFTSQTFAYGVSGDGAVVVGGALVGAVEEAFRWTQEQGVVRLGERIGETSGGNFFSRATAVSSDGNVVVGFANSDRPSVFPYKEAFRWTAEGGMVGLGGAASNSSSMALAVSGDGSVVVGSDFTNETGYEAVFWTEETGMQRLFDVLLMSGASGLTGWKLSNATAISHDGQWIVGTGINPAGKTEAFLANVSPVPIPAAAWLLGSAVGLLAWVKRRHAPGNNL